LELGLEFLDLSLTVSLESGIVLHELLYLSLGTEVSFVDFFEEGLCFRQVLLVVLQFLIHNGPFVAFMQVLLLQVLGLDLGILG
jgi:hypothetical protein